MHFVKKTVSLSTKIVDGVHLISSNFSRVVEDSLRDYLHNYHVKAALESFDKWESRDMDSVTLTNELRKEDERKKHDKSSH